MWDSFCTYENWPFIHQSFILFRIIKRIIVRNHIDSLRKMNFLLVCECNNSIRWKGNASNINCFHISLYYQINHLMLKVYVNFWIFYRITGAWNNWIPRYSYVTVNAMVLTVTQKSSFWIIMYLPKFFNLNLIYSRFTIYLYNSHWETFSEVIEGLL